MSSGRFVSLAIILLAAGACAGSKKSFDTPEAAIEHYAKSVAAADIDAAMQAFAIDEVSSRYDLPALAKYLPAVNPLSLYAPSHHPLYVRMNQIRLASEAANAVKVFTFGVLTDASLEGAAPKQITEADVAAFMAALDPARLKALKVVRIDSPMKRADGNPEFVDTQKRFAAFNGADEQTERLALYDFGGQTYWSGFQLLRYGKRWTISQAFSLLVPGPILGKTTLAEYEARLK